MGGRCLQQAAVWLLLLSLLQSGWRCRPRTHRPG